MWIRNIARKKCATAQAIWLLCGKSGAAANVVGHRGNAARLLQRVRAAADKSLGLRAAVVVESTLFS